MSAPSPPPPTASGAPRAPKSDLGDWIAAWVVGTLTTLHVAYYFPRIVDDAFISLRFAENLANGQGAVYNVGERVEGYSGPSWMLLQSLGLALGAEGVTWTKVLGLASLIALQLGVYRMARQLFGISKQLAVIGCLFLASNSLVIDWSTLGLETPLHLAMIVWCPVAVDAYLKRPWRRTRLVAIATVVGLATTRPESMMYVGWASLAVLGITAQFVARVDSRNSPYEEPSHGWVMAKKAAAWRGSVLAYRRVESPEIRDMDGFALGQITQAWGVLETSGATVADSWYFGRDIGAVGYYTGVRVFDTEGLFTPAVSDSKPWRDDRTVDDALIRRAMATQPVAAEIYDSWATALGRNPDLERGYRMRIGTLEHPVAILGEGSRPPDRAEILRRYDAFVGKFPRLFYVHTLYGESLGAAVEKRRRVLQALPPELFESR